MLLVTSINIQVAVRCAVKYRLYHVTVQTPESKTNQHNSITRFQEHELRRITPLIAIVEPTEISNAVSAGIRPHYVAAMKLLIPSSLLCG